MSAYHPCVICGKMVATWCCWKCYHKIREFDKTRTGITRENLWSDEYREKLLHDFLAKEKERVEFT